LALICIARFIQSYWIRGYTYPWGTDYFFKNDEYQPEKVDTIRNLTDKQFKDRMFRGYLRSIKSAEMNNDSKSDRIKQGQNFLTYTLIAIVVLVVFVLVSSGMGFVSLNGN
jgi:hypothetical protein